MRTGVALGANLGDRLGAMHAARERIRQLPSVRSPVFSSAVYETEPVDCEPGAKSFLNAVVEFGFAGDPHELLHELRAIEAALGRSAAHERNTSRTIDLDLLYFGDQRSNEESLRLPHPRLTARRFVLQPLADVRPELILLGQNETVQALLGHLPVAPAVVRFPQQW